MKEIYLNSDFKNISFDMITWSDNKRVSVAEQLVSVGIPVNDEKIMTLSKNIYSKSIEVINEISDFFEEFEEPFPKEEMEIYSNLHRIPEYMNSSTLWSYFIIENLSEILNWTFEKSVYHVLKCQKVEIIGNIKYLFFVAVEYKQNPHFTNI
jgi:hypothetical protein